MKRLFAALALMIATCVLSAQEITAEYEKIFKEGIEAFDNRQYKTALSKFKKVVNMPETSPGLRNQANEFIKTCNKRLAASVPAAPVTPAAPVQEADVEPEAAPIKEEIKHTLTVSPANLSLPASGGTKEITIESSADWEIMFKPEWCKVIESTDSYLKVWCDENTSLEAREGELVFSAADNSVVSNVHFFQEKGINRSGMVYFRTIPGNVMVEIHDSGVYGLSSRAHKLSAGSHEVRFVKDGYEPLDSVVVVPVMEDGRTAVIDVALKPQFGLLVPEINMEDNGKPMPELTFRINRKIIDISNSADGFSFDDDGGVIYNTLYKGGRIPLQPGVYEVSVEALGYERFSSNVTIARDSTVNLACDMKFVSGYVTVMDDRNAEGAKVVVDELGFSADIGEKSRLPVGEYVAEVRKDGYMLDDGIIEIVVEEGKETFYKAAMTRMVDCLVSTEVKGETVYVDGEPVPYQQPQHVIPLAEGKTYDIEIRKDDYWTHRCSVEVTPEDTLIDLRNIKLRQVYPLTISYDEPDIKVSLSSVKDTVINGELTVSPVSGCDTTLYLPYGRYDIKLTRRYELIKARRTAYKGHVNFNEKKNKVKIQTWSRRSLAILSGDYYITSGKAIEEGRIPLRANASFAQFRLCNGLSTSILRVSSYETSAVDLPFLDDEIKDPKWIFGASCLFTNYEFRMGGGFCNYGDANVLLSYSWCPPLTLVLPYHHFSGHEAFAGVELTSRIKVFNVNFRLGAQYINGNINCYNVPSNEYEEVKNCFTTSHIDNLSFVASVGFTLGGKDSKGRNVIRLW
ncbi:MAG: BACON domain-containing protein [Bacteroidales bacterium]|nr:BACON domain-containing protein [Bacteroidales bacterium]